MDEQQVKVAAERLRNEVVIHTAERLYDATGPTFADDIESVARFALTASDELAAAQARIEVLEAKVGRLMTIIEDAVSVGEMQGEDFLFDPWASLKQAADEPRAALAPRP